MTNSLVVCHKELWPQLCAGSSALPSTRVWSIPLSDNKTLIAGCKKTESEFVRNKLSVRFQATQNAKNWSAEPRECRSHSQAKSSEGNKQKEKNVERGAIRTRARKISSPDRYQLSQNGDDRRLWDNDRYRKQV